jgi:hypothetical protein
MLRPDINVRIADNSDVRVASKFNLTRAPKLNCTNWAGHRVALADNSAIAVGSFAPAIDGQVRPHGGCWSRPFDA